VTLRQIWPIKIGRRSIAAVEFALFAPLLLALFIGTAQILTLYRAEAKLNSLAYNVSQMISIYPTPIALANISDMCKGVVYGLQPFPPSGLTIAVASLTMEVAGATPTYDFWAADVPNSNCVAGAGTTFTKTSAVAALNPSASTGTVIAACDNGIIVRATLNYPGLVGIFLANHITLTQTAYARWRSASATQELTCTDCTSSNVSATPPCAS
jgi:hypothetical protein